MTNSKLTAPSLGDVRAGFTLKRNARGTRKDAMARTDRELGRLEEGLRHIKDTLDRHETARRQLYEKLDKVDDKVTKMEGKIETIEKTVSDLTTPVREFQVQKYEQAGAKKFRGLLMFIAGAIASTVLGATQFVKSLF